MRRLLSCLLTLIATSLAAAGIEGRAYVIDGDTITIEGTKERIRLYGIDSPEGRQTCCDAAGKRYLCGSRAADALAKLIGRNGRLTCSELDHDRYGRIVAECSTVGKVIINAAMVSKGWAIEYEKYSDGRYANQERDARAQRLGLWSGAFVKPWDWRRGERLPSKGLSLLQAIAPTHSLQVAARRSCKAAANCEEAVQMWCGGYSRADADHDGIPCENVCHSKKQVDAIKVKLGC